jgi:hypothetical protein
MTDKELREHVAAQLRTEISQNWGLDMEQYQASVEGSFESQPLLVSFTRVLNGARVEINEVYVGVEGTVVQWGIPELL